MKKVLIVDDHPLIRDGVAGWIARDPDLTVCGAVGSADDALQAVDRLQPDLVVTDLALRETNGFVLLADLRARHPGLPVLVLSIHKASIYAERSLASGAAGYVMKSDGAERLILLIRATLHLNPDGNPTSGLLGLSQAPMPLALPG